MPTATRKTRRPYDPGQPGEIIHEGGSRFIVESFRRPGEHYSVDVQAGTCSCPHFINRVLPAREAGENAAECKHLVECRSRVYRAAVRRASSLPTEFLIAALTRARRPELREALEFTLWARGLRLSTGRSLAADRPAVRETVYRPVLDPPAEDLFATAA